MSPTCSKPAPPSRVARLSNPTHEIGMHPGKLADIGFGRVFLLKECLYFYPVLLFTTRKRLVQPPNPPYSDFR